MRQSGFIERPVVLAIDQAAHSGWAVHDTRRVCTWGLAVRAAQRAEAIRDAFLVAREEDRELLVVYEDHSKIPASRSRNTATILGMGDARGRWLEQLEVLGHPSAWVMKADPATWRQKTIGARGRTEEIKQRAMRFASSAVQQEITDHNVAEAIAMACWAAFDGFARFTREREQRRVRRREARIAKAS